MPDDVRETELSIYGPDPIAEMFNSLRLNCSGKSVFQRCDGSIPIVVASRKDA